MKKLYEGMELEIIRFTAEDIITASVEMEDDGGTGSGSSSGDSGDDNGTGMSVSGIFHYGGYGSGAEGQSETHTLTPHPSDASVFVDENGNYWQMTGGEYYYPY